MTKEEIVLFKSRFPYELLNEIKWKGYDLSKVQIYYINRGSPDDTNIIDGSSIMNIGKAFLTINGIPQESYIPYHRIFMMTYDNNVIFQRIKKE